MARRGDMSFTAFVSSTTVYDLDDTLSRTASAEADHRHIDVLGRNSRRHGTARPGREDEDADW